MIIKRDYYLNQLIAARDNGLIKIVTGIRRCGKSFLLSVLFRQYLHSVGMDDDQIIELALDDRANISYRHPDALLAYIKSRMTGDKSYIVMLDEVQMVDDFVGVLNSLLHLRHVDTYVTGSNSRFLSKDVATEFRGRGLDIHLFPLSFAEYYSAVGGDKSDCLTDYYTYGGLPQVLSLHDYASKADYLKSLVSTVFIADVTERHRIKNRLELQELLRIMASTIGASCNPSKLSNTFKSVKNVAITHNTIGRYLTYLCDAFLMEPAVRYNIKGKRYINTLTKYYFTDLGLRNAVLDMRQYEETHLMENLIYNELRRRGFSVDVGCVETIEHDSSGTARRRQYEVDFVANRASARYYIQSALAIPDEAKMQQETASFRRIDDAFKRVLIIGRNMRPYYDENGILLMGIYDFLLQPDLLERG